MELLECWFRRSVGPHLSGGYKGASGRRRRDNTAGDDANVPSFSFLCDGIGFARRLTPDTLCEFCDVSTNNLGTIEISNCMFEKDSEC